MPRLHPPGGYRPPALDGEHILYRQQEVPIYVSLRLRDVLIHSLHKTQDGLLSVLSLIPIQCLQGRAYDHGDVISWELVLREELPNLHLHKLQKLRVIYHVGLVEEDHYVGNPNLPGKQDVLPASGAWDHPPRSQPVSPRPSGQHR